MGDLSLSVGGDGSGPSSSTRPPFDLNMSPEEEEPARSFDLNRPGDEPGPSPEEELLYLKEEKLRLKQAFQQAIQDFERLREAIDQSQESNPQSASALGEKLSGLGQKFKDFERMQERLCQLESDCYKTVRDSLEKELKTRYKGYKNVKKWDLFLTNLTHFWADIEKKFSKQGFLLKVP